MPNYRFPGSLPVIFAVKVALINLYLELPLHTSQLTNELGIRAIDPRIDDVNRATDWIILGWELSLDECFPKCDLSRSKGKIRIKEKPKT